MGLRICLLLVYLGLVTERVWSYLMAKSLCKWAFSLVSWQDLRNWVSQFFGRLAGPIAIPLRLEKLKRRKSSFDISGSKLPNTVSISPLEANESKPGIELAPEIRQESYSDRTQRRQLVRGDASLLHSRSHLRNRRLDDIKRLSCTRRRAKREQQYFLH